MLEVVGEVMRSRMRIMTDVVVTDVEKEKAIII